MKSPFFRQGRATLFLSTIAFMVSHYVRGQTLGDALNAPSLTWTSTGTGGALPWYGETGVSHDGVSAAASGTVSSSSSKTSILKTTVTGPGTLTFWVYVPGVEDLSLRVGGTNLIRTGNPPVWQQRTVYLGAGTQTLEWIYSNPGGLFDSQQGYVDEIVFTPGTTAPFITTHPWSQSQVPGMDTTFSVYADGTPPLSYQWQFYNTNIPNANGPLYTITNTQASNLGNYRAIISNAVDSLVSSNASLEFGNVTAWGYPGLGRSSIPPGATNVTQVAACYFQTAMLKLPANVLACGDVRSYDQDKIPADLTNAIAVAVGTTYMTVVVKSDGTVVVWGADISGQTNVPAGLSNVVAIAAGNRYVLALRSDGTVVAWGDNSFGQTNVPANVTNVVALAAGLYHNLALKADGTVISWGWNPFGQTNVPQSLTNAVAVAAGNAHSLALRADGTLVAWGNNSYGQTNIPAGLSNVVAISVHETRSLALRSDGTVVGWGNNSLGITNVPVGLSNVNAIATGAIHSVAVVGDGPPVAQAPMRNPTISSNGFTVSVPSQNGRVYALEYKSSLADQSWTALPLVAGNGTNLTLADTTASATPRFYRVRRW
jgi:hypothetical protein